MNFQLKIKMNHKKTSEKPLVFVKQKMCEQLKLK